MEIGYIIISLVYGTLFSVRVPHFASLTRTIPDSLAFVVIVALAVRAAFGTIRVPEMLRTIVRDASVYFVVIFTSHFVLAITLFHTRVSIAIASGIHVLLKPHQPNIQLLPAT